MRPLELTVEGFRSYRERTTFDLRGRRLVGIVGPIGAGKSSILDAVVFALYGKTPQVEGATKSLIHQLATSSHVELRFQVDGQVWRAVRSLRKKGASGHQLERLAADEPDAEILETVTLEAAVTERVQQLLGMDFKTFCRSVLLAQNRFAEFLTATPAQRDAVLKGVFGLERLDHALRGAKARVERIEIELEALARERERIAGAREALERARGDAEQTEARLNALASAGPEVERLEDERDVAVRDAAAATGRIAALEEIVAALPDEDETAAAIEDARLAGARVAQTRRALETAERSRTAREAELADIASRHGDRERFRSFEHLVREHERQVAAAEGARSAVAHAAEARADAAARVTARMGDAERAASARAEADAQLTAATAAVDGGRVLLADAQHAEMAHALRVTLVAGDPCPVCRQEVHAMPKAGAAPKVAAATRALARAVQGEESARTRNEVAATAQTAAREAAIGATAAAERTDAEHARAVQGLALVEAELTATKTQLVEWLGDEDADPRSLFEAREAELTGAELRLEEARSTLERTRTEVEEAGRLADGAVARVSSLANRLSGLWGRLDEDRDVRPEPAEVERSFTDIRDALVERHERTAAERDTATARADGAVAAHAVLLAGLGLGLRDDFRHALAEAGVRHGTAAGRVRELEERIAAASELESRVLALEAGRGVAKRLADDLQPSRFLGFLLEEERAELAELGSEHLEQLTDGAYRFTDDDRFAIVDLNAAGTTRKADSLSGGETFLASLALALALAEKVARGGGRLDSFFLDEGFGSLDPEHLDRAMDGIGRLVSADDRRLVVLVSHVAEMREAIEDLIVLDKHDVTGETIVRSGATPAA